MNAEESEHIVELVLTFLSDRGGFDHWWESIDDKTQEEIKQSLAEHIRDNTL